MSQPLRSLSACLRRIFRPQVFPGRFRSDPLPAAVATDSLCLGYEADTGLPLLLSDQELVRNVLIQGVPGVGHGDLTTDLLEQQTRRGGGWLYLAASPDRDTRDYLADVARQVGREDDFFVLDVSDPEASHTYSPVLTGDSEEIAAKLVTSVLPDSPNNPGSDFYKGQAHYALTVTVAALQALQRPFTVSDLAALLVSPTDLDRLLTQLPVDHPAQKNLACYLDQYRPLAGASQVLDVVKYRGILGGMAGRLHQLAQGTVGQVLNTTTPEIDISALLAAGQMCYVILMNKDTLPSQLARLLLADVRYAVADRAARGTQAPTPFLVLLEEPVSYVPPSFGRLIDLAHVANVALVYSMQTPPPAGLDAADLLDLACTKIFLQPRDSQAAEQISARFAEPGARRSRVSAEQLQRLPQGACYAKLRHRQYALRISYRPRPGNQPRFVRR